MATILLIDGDDHFLMRDQSALIGAGHHVLNTRRGQEGLELLHQHAVDLVCIDLLLPGMDALNIIELIHLVRPTCKIIAMSRPTLENDATRAKRLGAKTVLVKPFTPEELVHAVFRDLA